MVNGTKYRPPIIALLLILLNNGPLAFASAECLDDGKMICHIADPYSQNLKFYWKDDEGRRLGNIASLEKWLNGRGEKLVFAMNGGMFKKDKSPQGLIIEDQKTLAPLDTASGGGNFYLKPNGVFYLTSENNPAICRTADFVNNGKIKYATQSGPMLVIDGNIHPDFKKGSRNLNIRNGVGVFGDHKLVFAMSKEMVSLYEFAEFFRRLGCRQALYLDGFVSQTYLPEKKWVQTDGEFGVLIGVSVK